jgi:hypothetical protein
MEAKGSYWPILLKKSAAIGAAKNGATVVEICRVLNGKRGQIFRTIAQIRIGRLLPITTDRTAT